MKSSSHRRRRPLLKPEDLLIASQVAVSEERRRMAREIHDTLAQSFVGILFQVDALGYVLDTEQVQASNTLERIQELARSGLEEARCAIRALRPNELEGSTLPEALARAAQKCSRDPGFTCEFRQRGEARDLPPAEEDELFRIAQEATNNAREHARARRAVVTLEYQAAWVILTVRDNGVGFAAQERSTHQRGHGLTIMRERAQRIGARLVLENAATGGAVVHVRVPATIVGRDRTVQPLFHPRPRRAASRFRLLAHEG